MQVFVITPKIDFGIEVSFKDGTLLGSQFVNTDFIGFTHDLFGLFAVPPNIQSVAQTSALGLFVLFCGAEVSKASG